MTKEEKTIAQLVHEALIRHPRFRDSDRELIWYIWTKQGLTDMFGIRKSDFIGNAYSTESIRRSRQKCQQENPHLRSSEDVQKYKDEKEKLKGNFIYRE